MRRLRPLALVVLLLVLVPPARAGGPAVHEVAGVEGLGGGTLEGLALGADGILRPGPVFDATDLETDSAWAALRTGDDVWIGTGSPGRILRVAPDGTVTRREAAEALMVTALAPREDGGVVAAAFPGGRLLVVRGEGAPSPLATLPAEHVWALHPDGSGGLVAATGRPGALWHVDAFGAVDRLAEVGDDHARTLVRDGDAWIVGTAPKGRVLRVRPGAERPVEVVRELEAQEVVGLVPLGARGLLVAANADTGGGNVDVLEGLLRSAIRPPATPPGQEAAERPALQDGRVLWLEPSGAVTTLWEGSRVAALAMAADGDGALVGTYPSGRLLRVAPGAPWAVEADLPEAEASVLLATPAGVEGVVTSGPAVLHRRRRAPPGGTWTSAPLDAGAVARWGRIEATGLGIKAVRYRTGETATPDDTWGPWRPLDGFDGTRGGTGPTARRLQVAVDLEGQEAELRRIAVVAAAPNRAPRLTALVARRAGEPEAPGAVPQAGSTVQVTWEAQDPDGDRLRVDLHARREGSPRWIPIVEAKVLPSPEASWETAGLPDGVYRLRLVVSDEPDNEPGRARQAERLSDPFRVDNTAPHVPRLEARVAGDALLVAGEARDQPGGRIVAVRLSLDGGPWQVAAAVDGLLDEADEAFEATLPVPGPGVHDLGVQVRDEHGNLGAAATTFEVR